MSCARARGNPASYSRIAARSSMASDRSSTGAQNLHNGGDDRQRVAPIHRRVDCPLAVCFAEIAPLDAAGIAAIDLPRPLRLKPRPALVIGADHIGHSSSPCAGGASAAATAACNSGMIGLTASRHARPSSLCHQVVNAALPFAAAARARA